MSEWLQMLELKSKWWDLHRVICWRGQGSYNSLKRMSRRLRTECRRNYSGCCLNSLNKGCNYHYNPDFNCLPLGTNFSRNQKSTPTCQGRHRRSLLRPGKRGWFWQSGKLPAGGKRIRELDTGQPGVGLTGMPFRQEVNLNNFLR